MDLLTFFLWVIVFYFAFRFMFQFITSSAEHEEFKRNLLNKADAMIRIVKLEPLPDQGTILAYDGENNQFLGQGKDENELKNNIMQRFPEKVFLLDDKPFTANKKVEVKIEKSNTR
jgi:hypothetical protein